MIPIFAPNAFLGLKDEGVAIPSAQHIWELNGNAIDSGDASILYDGTAYGVDWVAGKDGLAASFGGGTYIDIGNLSYITDITVNGSLSFWLNVTDGSVNGKFFGHYGSTSRFYGLTDINYAGTGDYGVRLGLGSNVGVGVYSNMLEGVWFHIILTWDGYEATLWVNGVDVDLGTYTSGAFEDDIFYFGKSSSGTQPYNGLIDSVRIFDIKLTSDQVNALYNEF